MPDHEIAAYLAAEHQREKKQGQGPMAQTRWQIPDPNRKQVIRSYEADHGLRPESSHKWLAGALLGQAKGKAPNCTRRIFDGKILCVPFVQAQELKHWNYS
jgi:hypothetical protein